MASAHATTHHLLKFPLLSDAEIANSPSRKDGVGQAMEERRRMTVTLHLKAAANALEM